MNRFTLNKKTYTAAKMDFNAVCDLEDLGITMADFEAKPMAFTRAYLTMSTRLSKEDAGKEIEQHIVSGGKLEAITEVLKKEVEESDFFRSFAKTTETENSASDGETTMETEVMVETEVTIKKK